MKLLYLILTAIAAYFTAAAFRTIIRTDNTQSVLRLVAEKKISGIRCSPYYIPSADESIPLLTGWGNYSWKITTTSDSAQIYFNQGINMYYAFHIIESRASFDKATRFDPNCAMAWWGKALAFGPNINDFGYQRPSEAIPSATKANELKSGGTAVEKALIEAMFVRYSADSTADQGKLNVLYRDAMGRVFKDHKQDEHVSVLYADALMLLHPWDLYDHDFTPKAWTPEIVSVLKHSMQLNPKQPGAHHYFIHALEASAKPEEALNSATFLTTAMPEVSHLTHMPSHIYIRTGHYNKGIDINDKALSGYKKYLHYFPATEESSLLYDLHNVHMKLNCAQMAGNYKLAIGASVEVQQKIPAMYIAFPGALGNYVQYVHQSPLFTQLRFGKWNDILKEQVIDSLTYTPVLQYFARGIAYARTNQMAKAKDALELMKAKMTAPSLKEPFTPFNAAYDGALIAKNILEGVLAEQLKDHKKAIASFQQAVVAEDKLIYTEPRDWLLPARQYLGEALIKAGKYKEAITVFTKDLEINPNNGWSLTGIATCYKALNNKVALAAAQKRLKAAWLIKDLAVEAAVF
ncbi:MAG: tetratricopeptide repeat protein [Ferruginibacter sp.]